jgi:hypothetical protein
MREVPGSRECLFCGRPWGTARRSDEHVLPRWMRKHEQELRTRPHHSYSIGLDLDADARELVELPSSLVMSKSSLLTLKTRDVCTDCNNGWMSRLETAARPLILKVAEAARSGRETGISREDARTLALWCQKTAATNELTSVRPRAMTGQMGRDLAAGRPLRGSLVWMARHPRDYDLTLALTHIEVSATYTPRHDDPVRQIVLTAIVYHQVTFLVFITDSPGQQAPPLPLDRWTLLWPAWSAVDYPPPALVDGNELTRTMTDHRWMPTVAVSGIRRSPIPPEIRHRN